MRLIDADKLKAHYAWWENGTQEMREIKHTMDTVIDMQPTATQEQRLKFALGDRVKTNEKWKEPFAQKRGEIWSFDSYGPNVVGVKFDGDLGTTPVNINCLDHDEGVK